MSRFDVLITGYSLLLMIGGVTGYIMAGSVSSLLMSAIFAILLLGSLFTMRFFPPTGLGLIYGLLIVLTLFFSYRWYFGKFFPAGMMTLVSLAVFITGYLFNRRKI